MLALAFKSANEILKRENLNEHYFSAVLYVVQVGSIKYDHSNLSSDALYCDVQDGSSFYISNKSHDVTIYMKAST